MPRPMLASAVPYLVANFAVAPAGAAEPSCPIQYAILTASGAPNSYGEYLYGIRPTTMSFDGQRFTVTRATRVKEMTHNRATDDMRDVGYEAVRLQGSAGTLVVREQKVIGAPPRWTFSRVPKDAPGIRWGHGGAWRVTAGKNLWIVQEGPLAGYTLWISACDGQAAVRVPPIENTLPERTLDEPSERPLRPAPPIFTPTRPNANSPGP